MWDRETGAQVRSKILQIQGDSEGGRGISCLKSNRYDVIFPQTSSSVWVRVHNYGITSRSGKNFRACENDSRPGSIVLARADV